MNPSRIIITGTISSGKSTLSEMLIQMGYFVIDSDRVNRNLLEIDNINYLAIKNSRLFDDAFKEGYLDKKKLAEIIFSDKEKMEKLNKLTHKNIISTIEKMIDNSNEKFVFIEIPLFFSMKEKIEYDKIWLVDANRDVQINRLMNRDKISYEYALRKLDSQINKKEMIEKSDVIFDNSRDIGFLKKQLINQLENLEK